MGSALQRKGEYGICHRIFLWHILKKKKSEISKFETSDLTTHMVLAKGKKKLPHSLSL